MYKTANHNLQFSLFFCLLITTILLLLIDYFGFYPSYVVSTLSLVATFLFLCRVERRFTFKLISFVIIFSPALSPYFAWDITNHDLFSGAARYLQTPGILVNKTVFLYAAAAILYVLTVSFLNGYQRPCNEKVRIGTLCSPILFMLGLLVISTAFVVESGPTIISANYLDILSGRLASSSITTFIVSCFGGLWALLFVFGRHKRIIFWLVTSLAVVWLMLHARRVESFGIGLILLLWSRYFLQKNVLFFILFTFIIIQASIGIIRSDSISSYLQSINPNPESPRTGIAALPGGLGNIFLAGTHLVNVKDQQYLPKNEIITMTEWPKSLVPNFILNFVGLKSVQTEHDLVYRRLNLDYQGGMPLLTVFYLNGGFLLVLIFGGGHALMAQLIDNVLDFRLEANPKSGGTFSIFLAVVFILYQFRYHWYNPHTMIRVLSFSIWTFLLTSFFIEWQKDERKIKSPVYGTDLFLNFLFKK